MKTITALVFTLIASAASAQVSVKGYTTKNGTYVAPHQRTAPNTTKDDNYSTKGNVNPYTGKEGTVQPVPQFQFTPPPPPPPPALYQPPARSANGQSTDTKIQPFKSF